MLVLPIYLWNSPATLVNLRNFSLTKQFKKIFATAALEQSGWSRRSNRASFEFTWQYVY